MKGARYFWRSKISFTPMFHICIPWKYQKTRDFLTFSGITEWNRTLAWNGLITSVYAKAEKLFEFDHFVRLALQTLTSLLRLPDQLFQLLFFRFLALFYQAESLLKLDRASEAVQQLSPEKIKALAMYDKEVAGLHCGKFR